MGIKIIIIKESNRDNMERWITITIAIIRIRIWDSLLVRAHWWYWMVKKRGLIVRWVYMKNNIIRTMWIAMWIRIM